MEEVEGESVKRSSVGMESVGVGRRFLKKHNSSRQLEVIIMMDA